MKTKGLSKRKKTVSRISSEVLASPSSAEVVVVGGGASGVFVSILLAQKGYDVLCMEKRDQLLKKVAATGNGRCNFTNASLSDAARWEEVYTGTESDFVRPALEGCDDQRIRQIFLDWGMPSRVFPSGMVYPLTLQAQTVCERLTLLAHEAGVRFALNADVQYLEALSSKERADKTAPRYLLQGIQRGEEQENKFTLKAKALILATGGCFGIGKNEISN